MFCSVQSMGLSGIESYPVTVEVDCRRGLPRFDIVGLPDTAVKESRERVHHTALRGVIIGDVYTGITLPRRLRDHRKHTVDGAQPPIQ